MHQVSTTAINIAVIAYIGATSLAVCAAENSWRGKIEQGNSCVSKRALPQAEQCFRQALLEIDRAPHAAEDKSKCLNLLANTLSLEDKTSEAEKTLYKSLSILEQTFGASSPKLIPTLFAIGSIYESMGNHVLAMRFYSKASAISNRDYGPYCPALSSSVLHLDSGKSILKLDISSGSNLGGSASKAQAGLSASRQMKRSLPLFNDDSLKSECTSDEDLLADFKHDIDHDATDHDTTDHNTVNHDTALPGNPRSY